MTAQQSKTASFATAALVLGIIALLTGPLGIIPGILAVIFGVLGLKSSGRGKSIAGLVTGILGILGGILFFVLIFVAIPALQQAQRDVYRKEDVVKLSTQITTYSTDHYGKLPTADMISAEDLTLVQRIASSGQPTTEKLIYSAGEDCGGTTGARLYSLRIMLESGLEYCSDI